MTFTKQRLFVQERTCRSVSSSVYLNKAGGFASLSGRGILKRDPATRFVI